MDIILLLKALIMGVVEGLTEFLPISSTGHLIVTSSVLGLTGEKVKVFEIFIQTGAMLAIVWEYRERFVRVLAGAFSDRAISCPSRAIWLASESLRSRTPTLRTLLATVVSMAVAVAVAAAYRANPARA